MVTLTKNESHVVLLRFMMLITKVNVNIMRVRSRSNIPRLHRHGCTIEYRMILLHQ
jgi:hypothetical protein